MDGVRKRVKHTVLLAALEVVIAGLMPAMAQLKSTTAQKSTPPEPCCSITSIDTPTATVVAKVNASGQTFEFKPNNPALLASIRVGESLYANFKTGQVSLNGKDVAGSIVRVGPPEGPPGPAAPNKPSNVPPATQPQTAPKASGGSVPPAHPPSSQQKTTSKADGGSAPPGAVSSAAGTSPACCGITSVDARARLAAAKVNSTGQNFEFSVPNSVPVQNLHAGQPVWANFKARQVSLDGRIACCEIVAGPSAQPTGLAKMADANAGKSPAASGTALRPGFVELGGFWVPLGSVVSVGPNQLSIRTIVPTQERSGGAARGRSRAPAGGTAPPEGPMVTVGVEMASQPGPNRLPTMPVQVGPTVGGAGTQNQAVQNVATPGQVMASHGGIMVEPPVPPHVGQVVWVNRSTRQVRWLNFPFSMQQEDDLGDSRHLRTHLAVSLPSPGSLFGSIKGTTDVWTFKELSGFTGSVRVTFGDDAGNVLFSVAKGGGSDWHVCGHSDFLCGDSGITRNWEASVQPELLLQTAVVKIQHGGGGDTAWGDVLTDVMNLCDAIGGCSTSSCSQAVPSTPSPHTGDPCGPTTGTPPGPGGNAPPAGNAASAAGSHATTGGSPPKTAAAPPGSGGQPLGAMVAGSSIARPTVAGSQNPGASTIAQATGAVLQLPGLVCSAKTDHLGAPVAQGVMIPSGATIYCRFTPPAPPPNGSPAQTVTVSTNVPSVATAPTAVTLLGTYVDFQVTTTPIPQTVPLTITAGYSDASTSTTVTLARAAIQYFFCDPPAWTSGRFPCNLTVVYGYAGEGAPPASGGWGPFALDLTAPADPDGLSVQATGSDGYSGKIFVTGGWSGTSFTFPAKPVGAETPITYSVVDPLDGNTKTISAMLEPPYAYQVSFLDENSHVTAISGIPLDGKQLQVSFRTVGDPPNDGSSFQVQYGGTPNLITGPATIAYSQASFDTLTFPVTVLPCGVPPCQVTVAVGNAALMSSPGTLTVNP